ncbi:MAG: hypothetical protein ACK5IJ_00780 [Mangrovibacterium sp.]
MKKATIISLTLLVLVIAFACRNKFKQVDLSTVTTDYLFSDFDSELFASQPVDSLVLARLKSDFPMILPLFTTEVIRIGYPEDEGVDSLLQSFLHDTTMVNVKQMVDERINKKKISKELDVAFKYYKYHFPKSVIPHVFTCVSGFNQAIIMTDSILGIGVDKYLGRDCDYYSRLGISNYQQLNMYPQKITADAIYAWSTVQFPFVDYGHQLIDRMIYEGKVQYILDATLPDMPDSVKIGYTAAQIDFCKASEKDMWMYLAENKMLFSTNRMDIIRYTKEAPYTSSFSAQSPGRTGCWIGWQIVKSYMENNPEVNLTQLMEQKDARKILNQSAYNPQ